MFLLRDRRLAILAHSNWTGGFMVAPGPRGASFRKSWRIVYFVSGMCLMDDREPPYCENGRFFSDTGLFFSSCRLFHSETSGFSAFEPECTHGKSFENSCAVGFGPQDSCASMRATRRLSSSFMLIPHDSREAARKIEEEEADLWSVQGATLCRAMRLLRRGASWVRHQRLQFSRGPGSLQVF